MRKILTFMFLLSGIHCFSQTQQQMKVDAGVEFKNADNELNRVYKQILHEYKPDTLFIENLKRAQRTWIDFRDAEAEMKFPSGLSGKATATSRCRFLYLKQLTENRTETLKKWLIGDGTEGDVCSGTIKMWEPDLSEEMSRAHVEKDSSIWFTANINIDHRVFGYEKPDKSSRKLILFSVFTDDVKNNIFGCKYGAYYDTGGMDGLRLVYLSSINGFAQVALLRDDEELDKVYIDKRWFEFE